MDFKEQVEYYLNEAIVDIYNPKVKRVINILKVNLDNMKFGGKKDITDQVLKLALSIKPQSTDALNLYKKRIILIKKDEKNIDYRGYVAISNNDDIEIAVNYNRLKQDGFTQNDVLQHEIQHIIILIQSMTKGSIQGSFGNNKVKYIKHPIETDAAISSFVSKVKNNKLNIKFENYKDLIKYIFRDFRRYFDNKSVMDMLYSEGTKRKVYKRLTREGVDIEELII